MLKRIGDSDVYPGRKGRKQHVARVKAWLGVSI